MKMHALIGALLLLPSLAWAQEGGGGGGVAGVNGVTPVGNVLIIDSRGGGSSNEDGSSSVISYLQAIFDRYRVSYTVVRQQAVKTRLVAHGRVTTQFGDTLRYDAVIAACTVAGGSAAGFSPESLTRANGWLPTKPFLLIADPKSGNSFTTSVTESAGVGATIVAAAASRSDTHVLYRPGRPWKWKSSGVRAWVATTPRLGGYAPLVSWALSAGGHVLASDNTGMSSDADSCAMSADPDTVLVWERTFGASTWPGIVYLEMGNGQWSGDVRNLMMALARLHALSGNKIFNPLFPPMRIALHIDDGWRRGNSAVAQSGVAPADTVALKASIDSLASLRVPFVVGAQIDSMVAYAGDSTWWERAAPYVHYTPHTHGGAEVGPQIGRASYTNPEDLYGYLRARAAFGDGSCAGADTSIACLVQGSFARLERSFPGRIDHVLMPPFNGWVTQVGTGAITGVSKGIGLDSLIASLAAGGACGVRVASNISALLTENTASTGYYPSYRLMPVNMSPANNPMTASSAKLSRISGNNFSLIPLSGFPASSQYYIGVSGSNHRDPEAFAVNAMTLGRRNLYPQNSTSFGTDVDGYVRTIFPIHVSDLVSDANGIVTRPGWWNIKHLVQGMNAVNETAGMTLMKVVYPEVLCNP